MAVNDLNVLLLAGRLVADPEERGNGKVAAFSIASNRFFYTNGERKQETVFIDCSAFGYEAESVLRDLRKGDHITAEGRLELNQWTSGGTKKQKHRFVVNKVHSAAFRRGGEKPDAVPEQEVSETPVQSSVTPKGDDIPF